MVRSWFEANFHYAIWFEPAMADIQFATAEIMRGEKKEDEDEEEEEEEDEEEEEEEEQEEEQQEEEREEKEQTTGWKYNGMPYSIGRLQLSTECR